VNLDVHNHLCACGGDEADVSKGQVAEEDVCGNEEVKVRVEGQNDEQVPKLCDQVHGQEEYREYVWKSRFLSHPEEEIFIYMFDFVFLHCMATFEKHYLLKINKYAYTLYIHFEPSHLQVK
jgi:hypothetical protein